MSTSVSTHLFWILSRGAGITAMVLASVSVGFGLVMAGRLVKGGGADRRVLHEVLSLSVMVAIAVHGLTLLGASFIHFSLAGITVPFVSSYETLATSLGILAGWALIFLGLAFYARDRIGRQRFKLIHRFTLLAWVASLVHTFAEGTDAGQPWFIALIALTAAPAVVLAAVRFTRSRFRAQPPANPAHSSYAPPSRIRQTDPSIG